MTHRLSQILIGFVAIVASTGFGTSTLRSETIQLDRFAGVKTLNSEATGFFRLEKFGERDAFVTPEGNAYVALGINHISSVGSRISTKEPFTTQYGGNWDRYWEEYLRPQLFDWHVTSFGYGGPAPLLDKLPYFATIGIAPIEKHRNQPDRNKPGFFYFPDVFDPEWQRETADRVTKFATPYKDDPFLLGYLWTDTPTWSLLETRALRGTEWVSEIRKLPANSPGRQAYTEFVKQRYDGRLKEFRELYQLEVSSLDEVSTIDLSSVPVGRHRVQDDDEAFLPEIAKLYYQTAAEALRRADPNHLNFGDRYLIGDAPTGVLEAALPYIDAVAVQPGDRYSRLYPPSTIFPDEDIERLHRVSGLPILICDHTISYPTEEEPLTIFEQMPTEATAVEATRQFIEASFSKPYIIGYLRCQYIDRPAGFGRGLRQGVVRTNGSIREALARVYREEFRKALLSLTPTP